MEIMSLECAECGASFDPHGSKPSYVSDTVAGYACCPICWPNEAARRGIFPGKKAQR